MDFDQYALDVAAKHKNESYEAMFENRKKMLKKAYGPVLPLIQSADRILDFGCGSGDFLVFLDQISKAELCGYDPSKSQIALAKTRCDRLRRATCHDQLSGINGPFDVAFSLHVVEHLNNDELTSYLEKMIRLMRAEGRLIIATPNGLNPLAHSFFMSTDRTHVRMHSVFTLAETLRPLGWEVESFHRETPQIYDVATLAKTMIWWLSSQILRLGVLSVAPGVRGFRFPITLPASFYVVARKRQTRTV